MVNAHGRTELSIAKKVHRFTHAHAVEMKSLYQTAGLLTPELTEAFEKVFAACDVCSSEGRPRTSKKILISHVNEAFNTELQAVYHWVHFKGSKLVVLNLIDTGTRYGEIILV